MLLSAPPSLGITHIVVCPTPRLRKVAMNTNSKCADLLYHNLPTPCISQMRMSSTVDPKAAVAELEQQSDLLRDAPGVLDMGALEEVLVDMREQFVTGTDVEREIRESYVAAMLPEKLREGRRQQQWRKQGEEPVAENLEVRRTRDRHMR